ncbi:hypothetical protein VIRA109638_15475 [Vibrio rarus]
MGKFTAQQKQNRSNSNVGIMPDAQTLPECG